MKDIWQRQMTLGTNINTRLINYRAVRLRCDWIP